MMQQQLEEVKKQQATYKTEPSNDRQISVQPAKKGCSCFFKGIEAKDGGIEEDTKRLVEKIRLLQDSKS